MVSWIVLLVCELTGSCACTREVDQWEFFATALRNIKWEGSVFLVFISEITVQISANNFSSLTWKEYTQTMQLAGSLDCWSFCFFQHLSLEM